MDHESELLASPLEVSPTGSARTCSTPDTELSTPESSPPKQVVPSKERLWAREKISQLTLEEKVGAS